MKVMLAGPIKAWWEEWDSPRHQQYVAWRQLLSDSLVQSGHLVYRPHEAWKGEWEGNQGEVSAQRVNDEAIRVCDVIVNLTPEGVASDGTDVEMALCNGLKKIVLRYPPPDASDLLTLGRLLATLQEIEPRVVSA